MASCETCGQTARRNPTRKLDCPPQRATPNRSTRAAESSAIPVPATSPFRRYPHFYPQAQAVNLDSEWRNSVHNRHGDIFVNNKRQTTNLRTMTDAKLACQTLGFG